MSVKASPTVESGLSTKSTMRKPKVLVAATSDASIAEVELPVVVEPVDVL